MIYWTTETSGQTFKEVREEAHKAFAEFFDRLPSPTELTYHVHQIATWSGHTQPGLWKAEVTAAVQPPMKEEPF